ncbi:MAG TPA: glycosyltransferase family 39 protein [Casimicrobiaceae bacterium]|nr:glycosyltransferase family 39 protein [Casimicrobiaceae bacterium]
MFPPPAPASSSLAPLTRRGVLALLLAFTLLWFANLDYRRLVHPDEGRYAEIPREMMVTGDWVTPRLNGIKYFEKPALQYWLTAAGYQAFGVHPWTARLWPALAGYLGVLFIGYVGFRLGGSMLGVYSAAVLGGCLWYVVNAHILTLDAGLTLWMSVGLGSLLIAQRADATVAERRSWMWGAWAALALATLSKGLIGIVLPGAALVVYMLITRDWALWGRLHLISGSIVFFAFAAPWFVVASVLNPEFFDFFFIHEHFTRYLTGEHRREGAWWYFVPIFIVGILPWLAVFLWTAKRMWTEAHSDDNGFNWQRFALVWSAVIFVFFSVSGSKLPSYILPIFPALALMIGWQLTTRPDATLARVTLPLVVAAGVATLAVLFAYGPIAARFANARQPLAPLLAYAPWIKAGCAVAFVGGFAGWWWLRAGKRTAAVLAVALTSLAAAQLVLTGHDELAESRSTAPILSRIVAAHGPLRADVPFYTIRMYDQTLPYYLGRTVVQVDHPDELAMGLKSEPERAIATVGEWRRRWEAAEQGYAIMQPEEYDELKREGVPMNELGRDPRRVIVSRR